MGMIKYKTLGNPDTGDKKDENVTFPIWHPQFIFCYSVMHDLAAKSFMSQFMPVLLSLILCTERGGSWPSG